MNQNSSLKLDNTIFKDNSNDESMYSSNQTNGNVLGARTDGTLETHTPIAPVFKVMGDQKNGGASFFNNMVESFKKLLTKKSV